MQPDRIRLLQFLTLFGIGGTERQVLNLVKGMDASRFDLKIACLKRWGPLLNEMEATCIPIEEYKTTCLYNGAALKNQYQFVRSVRSQSFQIVHTYGFYCNVFGIPPARLAGVPVVIASIRDTGEHLTPTQRRVEKIFCSFAHRVVVNAEVVRQRLLKEGYADRKITVIPNGIRLDRFGSRSDGLKLRQEIGLPRRARVVTMLSRLTELKGTEYFLDAAALLAGKFSDVRFLVVGDGAGRPSLEQYARKLGLEQRVAFTGFRLDAPEILSETSVSVLPTLSEGLSNTLLESMAAGVPVVATRVGGNPEVVLDGATGFLVPVRDAAALAQSIGTLLEHPDLAARFGQAGRERVEQRFTIERMVQSTEALYEMLLEKSAGRRIPLTRKACA